MDTIDVGTDGAASATVDGPLLPIMAGGLAQATYVNCFFCSTRRIKSETRPIKVEGLLSILTPILDGLVVLNDPLNPSSESDAVWCDHLVAYCLQTEAIKRTEYDLLQATLETSILLAEKIRILSATIDALDFEVGDLQEWGNTDVKPTLTALRDSHKTMETAQEPQRRSFRLNK